MDIKWSDKAEEVFKKIISNLPLFHRTIAQSLVKETAEKIAGERKSEFVEEKDLIEAFFREVPPAFRGMMERLFKELGIKSS
ncbi:MAG: hypothetical protein NC820_06460 [Candidatus Omnitrophica bacterium]|nr:hypothetical protein [Candidatus Omnitrophota bacterium]